MIADAFLALLAVVIVMASGRQPLDTEVEALKREIVEQSHGQFATVLAEAEVRSKWARLVFSDETLSFPKCRWSVTQDKQDQVRGLFRWVGQRRQLLRQIRIEGHADSQWEGAGCKEIGPFLDNLQLSQNRARAIYNVLLGIAPEEPLGLNVMLKSSTPPVGASRGLEYIHELAKRGCLEVAGYGDRHPRDANHPDSPKNRRVEVVLEFRESQSDKAMPQLTTGCETTR